MENNKFQKDKSRHKNGFKINWWSNIFWLNEQVYARCAFLLSNKCILHLVFCYRSTKKDCYILISLMSKNT